MLKLTKTGIGLLTNQYRSVLRKCLRINAGLFIALMIQSQLAPAVAGGVVLGDGTSAENSRNVAIGKNAQALGTGSTAVGYNALANGNDSLGWTVAIGDNAKALGGTSMSIGPSSTSRGVESISIGLGAETGNLAESSVALGSYSVAYENYIVSVGSSTIRRRIVNVAAGQNDNDVVILKQLNDALNYYYTFRVDERAEVTEFTKELKASFPVILRSAEHDVRISAQSAAKTDTGLKSGDRHVALLLTMTNQGVNVSEAPLTFSAKTRDDSLFLGFMEVCHA